MLGAAIKRGYSGPSMAGEDWCIIDRARRLVGERMDSRMSSAAAITSRAKALALVGVAGPAASLPRILRRAADFAVAFRRLCAADADETADVKVRWFVRKCTRLR